MKKIFIILFLFSGLIAKAQIPVIPIDSSKLMVGPIIMESRDWESIYHIIREIKEGKDIEDSLERKYQVKPNTARPKNQELVKIDSSITQAWITVVRKIQNMDYKEVSPFAARVIKAVTDIPNSPYLQRRIAVVEKDVKKERDDQSAENRNQMTGKN